MGVMLKKCLYLGISGVLAVLMLSSCASLKEDEKKADKKDRFAFLRKDEQQKLKDKRETIEQEKVDPSKNIKPVISAESMKKLEVEAAPEVPAAKLTADAPKFYEDLIALNGDEMLDVSLVFNSAPLVDVVPAFADVLGFNFIVDSTIKSTVTLNLNAKMTRRELWNTFDRMLFVANTGATVEDSLVRITPLSQLSRQPGGNGEIYYYAFQNSTAKEVVNQIRPFLGNGSVCVELARPNAILICDEQSNMPNIL